MSRSLEKNIKTLLKKYGIYPSKRLGQNFLIDKKVLNKIIKAANPQREDIVLEIGPGIGNLTQELAKRVKRIIAVEKDPKMCEILKETLKDFKNVQIINKDILKFPMNSEQRTANNKKLFIVRCSLFANYKVVANLPYYITSPVIRKFLELANPPKEMILTVQKEVAQRICAAPPKMSILAVSVQFYAKPEIISYVSKKSFWPQPKVDSAILKISAFNQRRKSAFNQRFFIIVKAGFSQPRKQLVNNLSKGLALSSSNGLALSSSNGLALSLPNGLKLDKQKVKELLLKNNIQPTQRAETLTVDDWIRLTLSLGV